MSGQHLQENSSNKSSYCCYAWENSILVHTGAFLKTVFSFLLFLFTEVPNDFPVVLFCNSYPEFQLLENKIRVGESYKNTEITTVSPQIFAIWEFKLDLT